jgi:hypothetical protein
LEAITLARPENLKKDEHTIVDELVCHAESQTLPLFIVIPKAPPATVSLDRFSSGLFSFVTDSGWQGDAPLDEKRFRLIVDMVGRDLLTTDQGKQLMQRLRDGKPGLSLIFDAFEGNSDALQKVLLELFQYR